MKNNRRSFLACFFSLACLAGVNSVFAETPADNKKTEEVQVAPQVILQTNMGDLRIELFPDKAPITVQNFLHYVDSGFYNGVIFHRIVPGFVVQGGGFDQEYQRKATQAPIANESDNRLKNLRGTLSMARTFDPNSATSQFFINLKDNLQLDYRPGQPGYAVFGKLLDGLAVIDAMAEQPRGAHSGVFAEAPNKPIVIERAYRYHPETSKEEAPKSGAKEAPTKSKAVDTPKN